MRSSCTESTAVAERTQAELRSAQRRWESERERSAAAQEESRRLTEAYQQDSQEKLTFLHDLYQRLVAGCVLIKQPEGLLGSFSWPELRAVLQEHADALTSDLRRANEKGLKTHGVALVLARGALTVELGWSERGPVLERGAALEQPLAELSCPLCVLHVGTVSNVVAVFTALHYLGSSSSPTLSLEISHLECVRKSKEGLVRELQQSHESTLSKLAEQVKKQEETWQRQRQDLEQHHADLRAELGARAQVCTAPHHTVPHRNR
ncbi:hypothetical protein Z043_110122, partial [Scleropages formosus]